MLLSIVYRADALMSQVCIMYILRQMYLQGQGSSNVKIVNNIG